ncbi:MAG: tautomerase family protein [Limnochordaceae bacterium]|nr:tautomerase family protein [Limnochordaceae bacterium]
MPYVQCLTNQLVTTTAMQAWKAGVAEALAQVAGKPEKYLFVSIQSPGSDRVVPASVTGENANAPNRPGLALFVGGQDAPGAVIRLSLIGKLSREQKAELTRRLCRLCEEHLNVPPAGVYVIVESVEAEDWGWNGELFG